MSHSGGVDGRVSIEVDPRLAHDTDKTILQAIELWKIVDRPNLLIKIPATEAGIPAIASVLAEGISVNVTLIFSVERHRLVMFQEAALFPWLDVLGNVTFGLKLVPGLTRRRRTEIALEYLRLVKLERFARANLHELSGGMRQRVALARALAPDPRVLLMDEPFSALDALTREQLYDDLQEIWRTRRKTIVLVTHNVREAVCLGDRVVVLSPHPGRVREVFEIGLPRPRDINDAGLSDLAARITAALKSHYAPESML